MAAVDRPLRLAVGSHEAGSGKGCAMNVISWENGDTTITDYPACADRMLARIVKFVNDEICTHRDGDLLCPACSVEVLNLGHRIVGTGTHYFPTFAARRRVWVRVAADQARQVAHLNPDPRVMAAIEAAEGWCEGTVTAEQCRAATTAATAATAAYAARNAARNAAAAAYAAAANAADAMTAATAAAYAARNAAANALPERRLGLAHRAVDVWCQWAGFTPTPTAPEITADAVRRMTEVTA